MIVPHDQEEAMTVASRVAVMGHGKIVQVATLDAICETPNSVDVADFIGDVNSIECNTDGPSDGRHRLQWQKDSRI